MLDHDDLNALFTLSDTLVNIIDAVDSDLKCKKCMQLLPAKETLAKSFEALNKTRVRISYQKMHTGRKNKKAQLIYVEREEHYLYSQQPQVELIDIELVFVSTSKGRQKECVNLLKCCETT